MQQSNVWVTPDSHEDSQSLTISRPFIDSTGETEEHQPAAEALPPCEGIALSLTSFLPLSVILAGIPGCRESHDIARQHFNNPVIRNVASLRTAQNLFHGLTLCQFVDQLIQIANHLHSRFLDFFHAYTANNTLD